MSLGPTEFFEDMVKTIYGCLQKPESFVNIRQDSKLRRRLIVKDATLCSDTEKANEINQQQYAISTTWDLFVPAGGVPCGNHQNLLKGGFAWCAGHISIIDGQITFLSNNSGHYLPHAYHLYTFVEELEQKGLFAENAKLELIKREGNPSSFSVGTFLEAHDKAELKKAWETEIREKVLKEKTWSYEWLKTILDYS